MAAKLDALKAKKTDRTQGISDALKPRATTRKKTGATLPDDQAQQPTTETGAKTAPETMPEVEPQDLGDERPESTPAVLYLRLDVDTWIHEQATKTHSTLGQVILRTIEHSYDALVEKAPQQLPEPRRPLFAKAPRRAPRRRDGQRRRQLYARLTEANLKILDSLVDTLYTGNRSELVEQAVLEAMSKEDQP